MSGDQGDQGTGVAGSWNVSGGEAGFRFDGVVRTGIEER